jgi:Na+/melibiose symporter-like transporter
MVAGFALSLAGYDRDAAQQSPMVMDTVRLLTTAAPALFLGLGLIAVRGYPLTRARHSEILSGLAAREQGTPDPSKSS